MKSLVFNVIALLMAAFAVGGCTKDTKLHYEYPEGGKESVEDLGEATGAIKWMHEELLDKYLYNTEYAALAPKDFTKSYDEFLPYHLLQLDYNFDHRKYTAAYGSEDYVFSYVERESLSASGLNTRAEEESSEYSFGFVSLSAFHTLQTEIIISIDAIYADSPAERAGLHRGDIITKVNGQKISTTNYVEMLYALYYYSAVGDISLTLSDNTQIDLTPDVVAINPLLGSARYTSGSKTVGYINYVSFDYTYETQLKNEMASLGAVDELILDLRLNLGGYVSSANLLTALISSNSDRDQIFQYYRFNDDYMGGDKWSDGGLGYDATQDLYFEKLGVTSSSFSLPLGGTIYCLVSYETASASEMVINSLVGMGYNVILIGDTTRGKNVGMYGYERIFDGYKYTLWAINFQNLNCQAEGDYANGFTPDYALDEYGEWSENHFSDFADFGEEEILIKTALQLSEGTYNRRGDATRAASSARKLDAPNSPKLIGGSRKVAAKK